MVGLAACFSLSAFAQWQWIDKDGRKVFSDRPPPAYVPAGNILKQPGVMPVSPPAAAPVESASQPLTSQASPAKSPASSASGVDKELQERKAKAEAEEAAKKKAEEEKQTKAKAENCARARQAKATLDSGHPVTQSNAKGERIFLDEAGRAAESRRLASIMASDCPK